MLEWKWQPKVNKDKLLSFLRKEGYRDLSDRLEKLIDDDFFDKKQVYTLTCSNCGKPFKSYCKWEETKCNECFYKDGQTI